MALAFLKYNGNNNILIAFSMPGLYRRGTYQNCIRCMTLIEESEYSVLKQIQF